MNSNTRLLCYVAVSILLSTISVLGFIISFAQDPSFEVTMSVIYFSFSSVIGFIAIVILLCSIVAECCTTLRHVTYVPVDAGTGRE
jgi:hypothetical protein